MLPLIANQVG